MAKKRRPQPRSDVIAAKLKRFRGRPQANPEGKLKLKTESPELPEASKKQ